MATNKNITMKEFNGTDYDILYPKTIASQIPDVYSKSETYPASQLYTQNQLYTKTQIDQFINNLQTQVNGRAKIQVGSYVGTGTYGQNNPCVLTFDSKPKIVFVYPEEQSDGNIDTAFGYQRMIFIEGNIIVNTGITIQSSRQDNNFAHISISNNIFSWYNEYTEHQQLNKLSTRYCYAALL